MILLHDRISVFIDSIDVKPGSSASHSWISESALNGKSESLWLDRGGQSNAFNAAVLYIVL